PVASMVGQNFVHSVLGSGTNNVSNFTTYSVPVASPTDFVIAAAPTAFTGVTATGTREFCIDQSGVLGAKAAASSTVATVCTGFKIGRASCREREGRDTVSCPFLEKNEALHLSMKS